MSICKKLHVREKSRSRIISIIMSKLTKIDVFAHFLEFKTLDRSAIAYYASIKWVEAFAKEPRS